jgi:hypothetical protein
MLEASRIAVLTFATILLATSPISAASDIRNCVAPTAPIMYSRKPIVPYCVNEITHTHTCDEFTVSQYNSELEAYNRAANRFIQDFNMYVQDVNEYVSCVRNNL